MNVDQKLNDPAFFATNAHYALFDVMRKEDPVHWTQSPDGRGYWSVFRHADVKAVLNEPALFSSEREGVAPSVDAEMNAIIREAWGIGMNVATIDPAQLLAQLREHPMGLPVAQRLASAHAARADEEGGARRGAHMLAALRPVGRQRADRTRVQRRCAACPIGWPVRGHRAFA